MNTQTIRLAAVLALALTGCYAQLEDKSVVIRGPIPVAVPNGTLALPPFSFDVGDITVDQKAKDSSLKLRSATIVVPDSQPETFFNAVTEAKLVITAPADPTLPAVTLTYAQVAGALPGRSLKLADGEGTNLLPYLQGKALTVTITITGTGAANSPTDNNLDLEFDLLGKVTFP